MTEEDLATYRAIVTDAWSIPLGEFNMYFPPPPAGGAVVALAINIMKGCLSDFIHVCCHGDR